jgi:integrase
MISLPQSYAANIIKFPSPVQRDNGPLVDVDRITLRDYYASVLKPELVENQSKNSLKEDETAMRHWERHTANPDIRDATKEDLIAFRDGMAAAGLAGPTQNKYWRELRAILQAAQDDEIISRVPAIGRRMKCRLVDVGPKRQREPLTEAELERLWRACTKATYPRGGQFPAPLLWRVAIVLWWTYGQRTMDVLRWLDWRCVWWSPRVIRFEAMKTGKLQGLPLTPIVEQHLRSIKGHSERMFPGFNTPGCFLKKTGTWKRGYYATWNNEICRAAGLDIDIKHFRERAVTFYNGLEPGLGGWIAGHYMPGVTAQNYDLPTLRIRDAMNSAQVPDCFFEIG